MRINNDVSLRVVQKCLMKRAKLGSGFSLQALAGCVKLLNNFILFR